MEILKYYNRLVDSKVYNNWLKDNKDSYLFMVFSLFEEKVNSFDYIFLNNEISTSFIVGKDIKLKSEVYKEYKPEKMTLNGLEIDLKGAVDIANKNLLKYSKNPVKTMAILEMKSNVLEWNITLFLASFNTFNIKINAVNKTVIEHSFKPLFSRDKK
jgi:hypothetical protein